MRLKCVAIAVLFALSLVETAGAVAQAVPVSRVAGPAQMPAAPPVAGPLTIPAGTVVPLVLVSQIRAHSTKVGDTVRAQVSFPVTVGNQVAIPAGTYVEGTVTRISSKRLRRWQTNAPGLEIHFNKLIYANGYTVPLGAEIHARVQAPMQPASGGVELAMLDWMPDPGMELAAPSGLLSPEGAVSDAGAAFRLPAEDGAVHAAGMPEMHALLGQTANPQPAPLPPLPGPPKSFIIVAVVIAAVTVFGIIFAIHRENTFDWVVYDAGYPFGMAITAPLTVDGSQVTGALAVQPQ